MPALLSEESSSEGLAPVHRPAITDAEFKLFQKLFHDTIGMHLPPQKKPLVASRLGRRLDALKLPTYRHYFEILSDPSQRAEMQHAIDQITTNETSFFREREHFRVLSEAILPQAAAQHRLKVWCGAASTGEEPYTLAMVLSERLGLDGWSLLATDINSEVLAAAKKGLYPMARSKGIPDALLKKYCLKGVGSHDGEFLIDSSLRSRVDFRPMNLMDLASEIRDIDIVFLRNVLIYFDSPTRSQILSNIWARIRPGGWLVLGHSESVVGLQLPPLEQIVPSVYRKHAKGS
jgi:chemotaxis protein methyltransferase CheR